MLPQKHDSVLVTHELAFIGDGIHFPLRDSLLV